VNGAWALPSQMAPILGGALELSSKPKNPVFPLRTMGSGLTFFNRLPLFHFSLVLLSGLDQAEYVRVFFFIFTLLYYFISG
jgi:hypothetical protein